MDGVSQALSGDLGWGDSDGASTWGRLTSAMFLLAAVMYCGATWFASGLAPFTYWAAQVRPVGNKRVGGSASQ